MSNANAVDPYSASLTAEAAAIEEKLRQEMMKSAVKELAPYSGDGEEWLSWKDDTITLFTLAGRRIVLEENFSAEAQRLGWSPQQIADANRFVWTMLKSSVAGTKFL